MATNKELGKRIETLEKEVKHLKAVLQYQMRNKKKWFLFHKNYFWSDKLFSLGCFRYLMKNINLKNCFEERYKKQLVINCYQSISNFYAIRTNHFFLFLIWYCRTALRCCTSFSNISILFSSSSLVAKFLKDKFLDIYTIKKVTCYL